MKAHPFQYPGNTYILVKMECYKGKQSYDCHFCCCEFLLYIFTSIVYKSYLMHFTRTIYLLHVLSILI